MGQLQPLRDRFLEIWVVRWRCVGAYRRTERCEVRQNAAGFNVLLGGLGVIRSADEYFDRGRGGVILGCFKDERVTDDPGSGEGCPLQPLQLGVGA